VASSTNRLTLIAALVPPHHVTVHTVFCLRGPVRVARQAFLCGVLNSFVANFLARLWVMTHVSTAIVGRLPVPVVPEHSPPFTTIARLALALRRPGPDRDRRYVRIQAAVARLYRLSRDDFKYVLDGFPLVNDAMRQACLQEWDALDRRR
jgi:Zn-dependent protease with chaperone function